MRALKRDRERDRQHAYRDLVECVPGVQGGEPVLKGTRTPVRSVAILYYDTYPGSIGDVRAALPHLSLDQIRAALAYYDEYKTRVDADIARHREALKQFTSTS